MFVGTTKPTPILFVTKRTDEQKNQSFYIEQASGG
jgi:hypothetical protein